MRPIRTDFLLLFLLGALGALVFVPLKAAVYLPGVADMVGGILPRAPYWHGHEMLLGYSQAILGGYLMTRAGPSRIRVFAGLWLLARCSVLVPDLAGLLLSATANIALMILLFIEAGLPFLRAAKRIRSAIPGIVLALLLVAEAIFQAGRLLAMPQLSETALGAVAWLIILMLFLMGGRITAAATSGLLQRKDLPRPAAQGQLESLGLAALVLAGLLDLTPVPPVLAALPALAAAGILLLRLAYWRVWQARDRLEVSALHLGYGLLAAGLVLKALDGVISGGSSLTGLHGAMIGGLGILSVTIMTRSTLQKLRRPITLPAAVKLALVLLAAAAVARSLALYIHPAALISISALLWSLAYALFVWAQLQILHRHSRSHQPT
ncbi:NnrS family protein [Fodinicurvata fenggangensis]|uniref:NnrS family protein n=1 Tax=Fodinicurvata fenggangensis TaxID=1121830 RepID=UPI0004793BFA|nr:NnrS family protein [Fodinicurvata fenggangensis]